MLALPLTTAAAAKPGENVDDRAAIPADLRDLQVGVQSDVNEFTAPSIAKLFDTL